MNTLVRLMLILMLEPCCATSAIAEGLVSLGTGIEYSTGKYGDTVPTDILYVPVTAKYVASDLILKLTVPYLRVTGPGGNVRDMGRVGPMPGSGTMVSMMGGGMMGNGSTGTAQSGIGDVITSAGYRTFSTDSLKIDLLGSIKFGTANTNKNLGTGKNDYAMQIDGYYLTGAATLFASTGYKVRGSPPGFHLNNTLYGSIGMSRKMNDGMTIGGMLDMAQSPAPTSPGSREASLYIARTVAHDLKITVSILKGFSDSSREHIS